MDKIEWCLNKKDGISLVEPNRNLAEAYMRKAEDSLEAMRTNTIRDWKIATAYYAMYFSLYAVLMRIGVKCEIHSCTVEFAKRFLKDHFDGKEIDFLGDSLKARIDAQYYVNRDVPDKQFDDMVRKAPEFLVRCKSVLLQLSEKEVGMIRRKLK
jgi:uncharacterized protein (UPF0332 family)